MKNATQNKVHGEYNGWSNYATWNVFLWLTNDEGYYALMRECAERVAKTATTDRPDFYSAIVSELRMIAQETNTFLQTPDGVNWNDSLLNREELNNAIAEQMDFDFNMDAPDND